MHEHQNDEILSYVLPGVMVHTDSAGQHEEIAPHKLMVMNAGRSFHHQEVAPSEPVEMLQIFVRPEAPDLEPSVQFHDRPTGLDNGAWNLLAGPQGSGAPLSIRNRFHIFNAHPKAGSTLAVPAAEGLKQWLYVLRGELKVDGKQVSKGDGFADPDRSLSSLQVLEDAVLLAFLSDVSAPATFIGESEWIS